MLIKKYTLSLIVLFFISFFAVPVSVFAYGEGGYYGQGYYQGGYYAQGYYQSYYQSYYQAGYYAEGSYRLTFTQPVTVLSSTTVTGAVGKGGGSFVIDDPLDPVNKLLYHSFVESPDVKNLYDGTTTLDTNGEAVVPLPAYFELLNKDYRYQLKAIDRPMPNLYIKEEEKGNRFTIGGGVAGGLVSWQVTGIRHDPFIVANPIQVIVNKGGTSLVPVGDYVYPEGYTEPSKNLVVTIATLLILAILWYVWPHLRCQR